MTAAAKFTIFAVSDATGELAHSLAVSAAGQFKAHNTEIVRIPRLIRKERIGDIIDKAKVKQGVIIFTLASTELRQEMLRMAKENNVVAIDVMGPTLDVLANYFHELPSSEPGLQYKLTRNYFKRTEALEFTVKHDDGLGLDSLHLADVLLLGISRTSKTPLSIYLAYHGFRCANIPIVKGLPLPGAVTDMAPTKVVGLTIAPQKLATLRSSRLRKLGRPDTEAYGKIEYIREEIDYAQRIFRALDGIPVIDVTDKAIEETASDIMNLLKLEG